MTSGSDLRGHFVSWRAAESPDPSAEMPSKIRNNEAQNLRRCHEMKQGHPKDVIGFFYNVWSFVETVPVSKDGKVERMTQDIDVSH